MPKKKDLLTPREKQVAGLVGKDLKYREVAAQLGIGYESVKTYVYRIRRKLGLRSKVALALWAQKERL